MAPPSEADDDDDDDTCQWVPCDMCNTMVRFTDYSDHLTAHAIRGDGYNTIDDARYHGQPAAGHDAYTANLLLAESMGGSVRIGVAIDTVTQAVLCKPGSTSCEADMCPICQDVLGAPVAVQKKKQKNAKTVKEEKEEQDGTSKKKRAPRKPKRGEVVRTVPCSHSFCRGCLAEWLAVSRRCPVCMLELGVGDSVKT